MKSDFILDMDGRQRTNLITNRTKKFDLGDFEELISDSLNIVEFNTWNIDSRMPVYDISMEMTDFIEWIDHADGIVKEKVEKWERKADILALLLDISDNYFDVIPNFKEVDPIDSFTWLKENFNFWKIDFDKFQNFSYSCGFKLSMIAYAPKKSRDSWEYVNVLFIMVYDEKLATEYRGSIASRKFNF